MTLAPTHNSNRTWKASWFYFLLVSIEVKFTEYVISHFKGHGSVTPGTFTKVCKYHIAEAHTSTSPCNGSFGLSTGWRGCLGTWRDTLLGCVLGCFLRTLAWRSANRAGEACPEHRQHGPIGWRPGENQQVGERGSTRVRERTCMHLASPACARGVGAALAGGVRLGLLQPLEVDLHQGLSRGISSL